MDVFPSYEGRVWVYSVGEGNRRRVFFVDIIVYAVRRSQCQRSGGRSILTESTAGYKAGILRAGLVCEEMQLGRLVKRCGSWASLARCGISSTNASSLQGFIGWSGK
jgi:hypothetical protein